MTGTPDSPVPGNAPPLRVLVADDQTTVREGLVTLLGLAPGIQVVGVAADGAQAIALTADLHPDVVLMDLGMPTIDGVTATARIRAEHPDTRLFVTEATVKTHINHLFSKTGTHDRAQAVSYAYHHHLTNPPSPSPGPR